MSGIRYFNIKGRQEWSNWLEKLQTDPLSPFPHELLQRGDISHAAPGKTNLPDASESKFKMAANLAEQIGKIEAAGLPVDRWPGLWDWLAAYYFDSICPPKADGTRLIKALANYRFDPDYQRYYRHRICGPVSRFRLLGDHSRILLYGPPSTLTDWEEQAAARYETGGNPGVAEVLCLLYWDEEKSRPKKGASPNKMTPGTLRRFGVIIRQFSLTYDLSRIGAQGLLELLPNEFNKWKSAP